MNFGQSLNLRLVIITCLTVPAEVLGHKGVFSGRTSASPSPSRSGCIQASTIPDWEASFPELWMGQTVQQLQLLKR